MDSKNRISRLMREEDEQKKIDLLLYFHNHMMGDAPLDDEELDELLQILRAKKESIAILTMLWRLALKSKFHKKIEQYSREIVEKSEKTYRCFVASCLRLRHSEYFFIQEYRRFAVSYLQIHNSAYFIQNFEKFMHDRDPYILYEVACEIGKTSMSQKIAMMIQFYHKIETHDLGEIVTAEILGAGTVEHLEMIQEK